MNKWILFVISFCVTKTFSQSSINDKTSTFSVHNEKVSFQYFIDSTPTKFKGNKFFSYDRKKENAIEYVQAIGYGLNFAALYNLWYKDYPKSSFHFFDDNPEYLQVDKASHAWGAYTGGNMSMQMWKWAGVPKKKYVWLGGLTGLAYMTAIEVMDGFSEHWGFSKGDYAANMLGAGLLIGQELLWDEQRITIKYSVHIAKYDDPVVNSYLNKIYGKTKYERLMKDYNAQTYWLSCNLKSFFRKSNLPDWLNVAVGYGGQEMMGARWDGILNPDGSIYDNTTYNRYRQWYLAPDIDLTKIKTKSKVLKTALFVLNSFKFPTPSLEFSQGDFKWNWIHF